MSEPYHVRLTPPAARALYRLPPRIADAVIRFLEGPLAGNPQRVTKPLGQELSGLRSGYVGVAHRILVSIDEDQRVVVPQLDPVFTSAAGAASFAAEAR
jgi:mRNA-degrading endonuclease RelE of RelBE toxin-antitoxin system